MGRDRMGRDMKRLSTSSLEPRTIETQRPCGDSKGPSHGGMTWSYKIKEDLLFARSMQCINPTHFPSSIYAFHIIYLLIDVNSTSSSLSVHCVHSPTDPVSAHGQHLSEEICIDHIANGLHVILLGSQIRTFCSKALKCWVILLGDLCILDSKCCLGMRISDVPKIQLDPMMLKETPFSQGHAVKGAHG